MGVLFFLLILYIIKPAYICTSWHSYYSIENGRSLVEKSCFTVNCYRQNEFLMQKEYIVSEKSYEINYNFISGTFSSTSKVKYFLAIV